MSDMAAEGTDLLASHPDITFIDDDDLNGACFIAGAEGEAEELIDRNIIYFPADFPRNGDANAGNEVKPSAKLAQRFVYLNYRHLVAGAGKRNNDQAAKISYIRFLAARNGLVSPAFTLEAHNVRYNHAVNAIPEDDTIAAAAATKPDAHMKEINAVLNESVRKKLRLMFADMVCSVAYIFRVRGHHYRPDIRPRYITLWSRCLHTEADLLLDWELVATDALHAIMPDILDNFWEKCVNNSLCAGALIKRYDSAPAGVAGVLALKRGLDDVNLLFPKINIIAADSKAAFDDTYAHVSVSRWGGSINHRFYGVTRIRVNEQAIGVLASVVMGIYEHLAPDAKLRDSPALRRLAEIAPATGGAIGMAAVRASKDERLNLIGASDMAVA